MLKDIAELTYGTTVAGLTEVQLCQIEDHIAVAIGSKRYDGQSKFRAHQCLNEIANERIRRRELRTANQTDQ
jgi:stress-induced morphogen